MKPSESISSFMRHMPAEALLAELVPVRSGCRADHWSGRSGSVSVDTTVSYE